MKQDKDNSTNPAGKNTAATNGERKNLSFSGKAGSAPVLFGSILKEARKKKKIAQGELADMLGISRFTVRNWETDANKPDYDTLPQLCGILGISIHDLFASALPEQEILEHEILHYFLQLSPENQRMATKVVSAMYEAEQEAAAKEHEGRYRMMKVTTRFVEEVPGAVAAGTGFAFQEVPSKPFFIKTNNKNRSADAVVRVSGHSMEPDYHDGDRVYFKYTKDVFPGDDVVAGWHEGAIVKRLAEDHTLYSVNPDIPFVYDDGDEGVRIIGKVLGIVDPGTDLPEEADLDTLQELFHDEIRDYDWDHRNVEK